MFGWCLTFDAVYINGIVKLIGSNIHLFADDTSLFVVVDNTLAAVNCLNADLSRLT